MSAFNYLILKRPLFCCFLLMFICSLIGSIWINFFSFDLYKLGCIYSSFLWFCYTSISRNNLKDGRDYDLPFFNILTIFCVVKNKNISCCDESAINIQNHILKIYSNLTKITPKLHPWILRWYLLINFLPTRKATATIQCTQEE